MFTSKLAATYLLALLATLVHLNGNAQHASTIESPTTERPLFRPQLQMGFGQISYFGDVGQLNGISQRQQLNWGHHLALHNPINDAFSLNVFALFGKITAAERLASDNYNFQTGIRMGGLSLSYNFKHLLPAERLLTPYLSVGISTFEFNPKGDRQDSFGREYHHWSDGSLRSLPEAHPNAQAAIPLTEDRTYETDLRSAENAADLYALRALSIPVGAGVDIKVSDKFKLRMGAEYHFTNTDYLDGIAYNPEAQSGRMHNDRFLYSHIGLTYNLHHTKPEPVSGTNLNLNPAEYIEFDEDGDGIVDLLDQCPGTPAGVPVDENGCPLDGDGDGVADYLDQEVNSPMGSWVNELGIALGDEDFEKMYKVYMGELYAQNYQKSSTSTADINKNVRLADRSKGYRLTITGLDQVNSEQLSQLLSIAEVRSQTVGDEVVYYAGDYQSTTDYLAAALQLRNAGFEYKVQYNTFGELTDIDESHLFDGEDLNIYAKLFNEKEVTFRVQIGAFSKSVSPKLFKDIPQVLVIPGTDGLTRFVSGAYSNMQDAAKHRVDLLLKGYEGAFVTAYKGGKRISLKEAGAQVTKQEDLNSHNDVETYINKDLVKYGIQLGVFKGRIPAETLGSYMSLGNVKPMRSKDGVTKYIYGVFNTSNQAKEAQESLKSQGFSDTFVVGEFNGQLISADEAKKIKGE